MITAHLFVPQIFIHWLLELLGELFEFFVELFEHLRYDSKEDQVAHNEAAYNQRRIDMFAEIETGVSDVVDDDRHGIDGVAGGVVEEYHRQRDREGDLSHVNWSRHGPDLDRAGEQ